MKLKIKKICCIGAGYVGGPSMAILADKNPNITVNVVDMNKNRISGWNHKDLDNLPIYEPGLKQIVKKCRNKNLFFSTEIEENVRTADMIFISVNTPTKTKGIGAGQAIDLKWIESCARQIGRFAQNHTIVVEKSTLPVRTAETIKTILDAYTDQEKKDKKKCARSFSILSNPEFLAEGTAINDLENPDRVLIGGDDDDAINSLSEIYLNWIEKEKILKTDIWSSELSKLIANAFLAQRISSINSVSALCEESGANINYVAKAVGMDTRIGKDFLNAGPGFGGSCFKKDILNLIYICNHYGLEEVSSYWQKIIDINDWQKIRITKVIIENLFGTISEKKIAVLGFAFKPNTNDTRESPSISICKDLLDEGCNLSIYDPKVKESQIENELNTQSTKSKAGNGEWSFANSLYEAVNAADAIIFLTEWDEFANLNFERISKAMNIPKWIFDTRNIVDVKKIRNYGFKLWKLGEGKIF